MTYRRKPLMAFYMILCPYLWQLMGGFPPTREKWHHRRVPRPADRGRRLLRRRLWSFPVLRLCYPSVVSVIQLINKFLRTDWRLKTNQILFNKCLKFKHCLLSRQNRCLRPRLEGSVGRTHRCLHFRWRAFGHSSHHFISGLIVNQFI